MRIAYTVSQPRKTLHEHHFSCTRERTRRGARTKKTVGMHLIAAVGEPEMRVCNRAVGWPEMDSIPPIGQTEFVAVGPVCRDSSTFGVRGRLQPRQIFIARDTFNMCHQSYESVSCAGLSSAQRKAFLALQSSSCTKFSRDPTFLAKHIYSQYFSVMCTNMQSSLLSSLCNLKMGCRSFFENSVS